MQDTVVIADLIVFALLVLGILQSPWMKGMRGQRRRVDRPLRARLDASVHNLFSDLILLAFDGTTQIDHVVVSRFSVFVIETKNVPGVRLAR